MDVIPTSRSSYRAPAGRSIGDDLVTLRLDDRVRRVTRVVAELRTRSEAYAGQGRPVPAPLSQALDDFTRQLASARDAVAAQQRAVAAPVGSRRQRRRRTPVAAARRP